MIRSDRRILRLYLAAFSAYVALYIVVIFVPQLLENAGLGSAATVGLFLSGMNLAAFGVASNYGRMRRHVGVRTLLWVAGVLYIGSAGVLVLTDEPGAIVAAMLLFGSAHGIVVPAVTVSVGNCAPPPMRGRVTSGLGVTNYLGQFSSPYIAAPFVAVVGVLGAFFVLGFAGAVVAISGAKAAQQSSEAEPEGTQ